jgi:hypothetical protein
MNRKQISPQRMSFRGELEYIYYSQMAVTEYCSVLIVVR